MAGSQTISQSETRVEALKLQSSSYGVTLALAYGRTRVAGNLMWFGGFEAIPHTTTQGGGGKGGGIKMENTTYSYKASVAMGITETPITDIPRIWKGRGSSSGGVGSDVYTVTEVYQVPVGGGSFTVDVDGSIALPESQPVINRINPAGAEKVKKGMALVVSNINGPTLRRDVDYQSDRAGTVTFPASMAGWWLRLVTQFTSPVPPPTSMFKLGLSLFSGEVGQPAWSTLSTKYPGFAVPYSGVAYVAGEGYSLGSGAQVENHNFELLAPFAYTVGTSPDADPADITADVLCDDRYGAGFDNARLDLTEWSFYCRANNLLMSPALTEQGPASDFVDTMCKLTNSMPVWSDNRLKIVPRGDTEQTAHGVTYTPELTPVYDLTDEDFLPMADGESVHVTRGSPTDACNQVTIEFLNRDNQYSIETVERRDLASINSRGLRAKDILRAHWICDPAIAARVAQLMLQRENYVRNTYEFKLPRTKCLLEPGDLVRLNESGQGLVNKVVRVVECDEAEDGEISIEAEDCPIGIGTAAVYPSQSGQGYAADYNVSPGPVSDPVFFEPPVDRVSGSGLAVWCAVSGVDANWGGCRVWVSLNGTNYKELGRTYGGARYGTLAGPLGAASTGPLAVSLAGRGGQLLNATPAEADALTTLCMVDGGGGAVEFLAYETAELVGANAYNLTGLRRAAFETGSSAKAAGSRFVRIDDAIVKGEPLEAEYVGRTISFKFTSFNIYGGAEENLADVPEYSYTITGVMAQLKPGVAGKAVRLKASSLVVQVSAAGVRTPAQIELTSELKGLLSGMPEISVVSGTAELVGSGFTRTIATAGILSEAVTVRTQVADPIAVYSDELTITLVREGAAGTPGEAGSPGLPGEAGAPGAPGTPGAAGANAVAATLTNDAVAFPADMAGNVISYMGGSTSIVVTVGAANDTANWTLSRVNGPNISSTLVGATLTVDGIAAGQDASYVDISATRAGFATLTKRFSVTKAKQGSTGATGSAGAPGAPGAAGAAGAAGSPGVRGNVQLSRTIAGTAWSDTEAVAALTAAGFASPVFQDRITLVGASGFVQTRFWSGSQWTVATAQLDGNLFVQGTIAGDALKVQTINTQHLIVGSVSVNGSNESLNVPLNPAGTSGFFTRADVIATLTSSGGFMDVHVRIRPNVTAPSTCQTVHHTCVMELVNTSGGASITLNSDQGGTSHPMLLVSGTQRGASFLSNLLDGRIIPAGTYDLRVTQSWSPGDGNGNGLNVAITGVSNFKVLRSERRV